MDFNKLEIGSTVILMLKSSEQFIGNFTGYNKENETIALKNVRFLYKDVSTAEPSSSNAGITSGEILVECQQLQRIEILVDRRPASTSNLVRVNSMNKVQPLNWFLGKKPFNFLQKNDMQMQLQESMKYFCKKLFDNSNFVRLITGPQDKEMGIGLPQYYVRFHREPIMPVMFEEEPSNSQQYRQLVSAKSFQGLAQVHYAETENCSKINECLAQNYCASEVSEFSNSKDDGENEFPNSILKQLTGDMKKLDLNDVVEGISPQDNSQSPQFSKYFNGTLYLNEEFFKSLYPAEHTSDTENTSLCVEEQNNFVMDWEGLD